jgi:hypothetical protein
MAQSSPLNNSHPRADQSLYFGPSDAVVKCDFGRAAAAGFGVGEYEGIRRFSDVLAHLGDNERWDVQ